MEISGLIEEAEQNFRSYSDLNKGGFSKSNSLNYRRNSSFFYS